MAYVVGASEGDLREVTVEDHGLSEDWSDGARGGDSEFLGEVHCIDKYTCIRGYMNVHVSLHAHVNVYRYPIHVHEDANYFKQR